MAADVSLLSSDQLQQIKNGVEAATLFQPVNVASPKTSDLDILTLVGLFSRQ